MTARRALPSPPESLLRRTEAAELLAISTRTLARLTSERLLPCVRLGRSVRYSLADLQRLISQQKQ